MTDTETKIHKTRGGDRLFTDEIAEEIRNRHHAERLSVSALRKIYCPDSSDNPIRYLLEGKTYKNAGGKIGVIKTEYSRKVKKQRTLKVGEKAHDAILQMIDIGMSQNKIAKVFGVSHGYINKIVRKLRPPDTERIIKLPQSEHANVIAMLNSGMSPKDVAVHYDVVVSRIYVIKAKYG